VPRLDELPLEREKENKDSKIDGEDDFDDVDLDGLLPGILFWYKHESVLGATGKVKLFIMQERTRCGTEEPRYFQAGYFMS